MLKPNEHEESVRDTLAEAEEHAAFVRKQGFACRVDHAESVTGFAVIVESEVSA